MINNIKFKHFLLFNWQFEQLMVSKLNYEVPDLSKKWSFKCWSCYAAKDKQKEFKTCAKCKIARYCDKQCQEDDWTTHKLLHKELKYVNGCTS